MSWFEDVVVPIFLCVAMLFLCVAMLSVSVLALVSACKMLVGGLCG